MCTVVSTEHSRLWASFLASILFFMKLIVLIVQGFVSPHGSSVVLTAYVSVQLMAKVRTLESMKRLLLWFRHFVSSKNSAEAYSPHAVALASACLVGSTLMSRLKLLEKSTGAGILFLPFCHKRTQVHILLFLCHIETRLSFLPFCPMRTE